MPCKLRFLISAEEFCKNTEISVCAALSNNDTFSLVKPTSMIDVPTVGAIKMPCAADTAVLSTVSLFDTREEEPIIEMDTVTTGQN